MSLGPRFHTRSRHRGYSGLGDGIPDLPGGLTGLTGKLAVASPLDLLPAGRRVRGVNLALSRAEGIGNDAGGAGSPIWSYVWSTWDMAGIEHRLDEAVEVGANTVRMIGTVYGIVSGALTRTQYFTRWDALSAACQARGLFLYPGLCDRVNDNFGLLTQTQINDEVTAAAGHIGANVPDVIGLDLVQESWGITPWANPNGYTLYSLVKAVTDLPCTFSSQTIATPTNGADSLRDFIDDHYYGSVSGAQITAVQNYLNTSPTKPYLIGEFGSAIPAGQSTQVAYYDSVRSVVNLSGTGGKVAGALVWCVEDYNSADDGYGMWSNNGTTRRTWLTDAFAAFPTT